jgi:uncharacterized protein
MDDAHRKLELLRARLTDLGGVLVAYSGGVDSTFLLTVAHSVLGDQALGVVARSETYPAREAEEAIAYAAQLGVRCQVIHTEELDLAGYADNPPDRCYYCKRELFEKLLRMAAAEGRPAVADGSNADDLGDWRPGMKAGRELGVRSLLQEVGLTKAEIRELSREMGLPTWDKPSLACLASRFPYGTPITAEKLSVVERAEEAIRGLGFRQVRVRHHGDTARIEVPEEEVARLLDPAVRRPVVAALKQLGYVYVTADLAGYRSGSMNEALLDRRDSTNT